MILEEYRYLVAFVEDFDTQKIKSVENKTSFVKAEDKWLQCSLLNPAEIAVICTDDNQSNPNVRLLKHGIIRTSSFMFQYT